MDANMPLQFDCSNPVTVTFDDLQLEADCFLPQKASGLVVFAHGSGSSRHSPRNRHVAHMLNEMGLATLLIDLLTMDEEQIDLRTTQLRFDIGLLANRLVGITQWIRAQPQLQSLKIGYFGSSTGGGGALVAAATHPDDVDAVVSRGGRPDLAGSVLPNVKAPTLLIVGGHDDVVIQMNKQAQEQLIVVNDLVIVPGATHLFEEPGTLDQVAKLAGKWFQQYLA